MTSKVLTNEYKENINDGTIMTYGSPNEKECDVISIGVRGRMKPTVERKDYKEYSKQLKSITIVKATKLLNNCDWIHNHYIFACDFTEKGIMFNKSFRFKYQIYIKPLERQCLSSYQDKIEKIITIVNGNLGEDCASLGFEVIK